jgi:Ca-activated chloride channel family protein
MIVRNASCFGKAGRRLALTVCLLVLATVPRAESQSMDQVNITPRQNPEIASSTGGDAPLPGLKPRPLRVDVNLVLVPVSLVLDFSGSMRNKIDYEREAVSQFFQNANPEDDYYVITVSDRPTLVASSSDGGDNRSRYTLKEIRHVGAEADILTYSIGIFDDIPIPLIKTIEEKMGRKWLDEITSMSGGRDIAADNRKAIPQIAALISRELRSQYVIGYRPTDPTHDGKWRKISVKLVPADMPGDLRVHSKQGYIAPGP